MKILVELRVEWDSLRLHEMRTPKDYYDKYYKEQKDILFDAETESIYYEIELPFIPIVGQLIGTKFGACIVTYSYLELEPTQKTYYDYNRIIVDEQ